MRRGTISSYQEQINCVRRIGECLRGGEFVESPFDDPVEEERRGDPDQIDDDINYSQQNLCVSIEPDLINGKKNITSIKFDEKLRYFLDGSLRTKYLGEFIEQNRCFPILATETSCAIVKKDNRLLLPHNIAKKIAFIFPHKSTGLISDSIFDLLEDVNNNLARNNSIMRIEFLQNITRDVRYSMQGKARSIMHNLELEGARQLQRNNDAWLVMDGAIRKAEFLGLTKTIGLAKSFSRKPVFDLGDGKPLMITKYLSKVREGERSAVFKQQTGQNEKIAFWYLRIRTYPPMEPLGGLVKIEMNFEEDKLSEKKKKLIDEISAEVFAYRNPSIYPYPRWPSFIYPIRITELLMKSARINGEMLAYYGRELSKIIREN